MISWAYRKIRAAGQKNKAQSSGSSEPKQQLCHHQQEALERTQPQSTLASNDEITSPSNEPSSTVSAGPCEACAAEKSALRRYRWKLLLTLLVPNFMASMDLTIVATALPTIASHFNKLNQFNWVVTAFTIATTTCIPIYGQLADVFGRHGVIQFSIMMVLIGSVLCTAAQVWPMLLLGRALQGVGFAGLQSVTDIILADKVSLKENSRNVTIFDLINGISYGVGPTIGGYLTRANWRWCFIINIPIAVIAHLLLFFLLRHDLVGPKAQRLEDKYGNVTFIERTGFFSKFAVIDHGGILLFFFGVGLIVLGLSWGGGQYSWNTTAVIVPLAIGGALTLAFILWEYLMESPRILSKLLPNQDAMIPFSMFRSRDVTVLAYLNFSTGMALYSVFYFVGVYFNIVKEYDSGRSGLQLLFYLPGLGFGVYSAIFLCNAWPKHTFYPLFIGSVIEPIGMGLLTWALNNGKTSVINGMLGLAGFGTGIRFMPGTLHALGIMSKRKARAIALMSFCIPMGGTVGIAVMGTVFNNKLSSFLLQGQGATGGAVVQDPTSQEAIANLPPEVARLVRDAVRKAVYWAYISVLPFLGLAGVAGLFLGDVKITDAQQDDEGQLKYTENVVDRPYLWFLLTGKKRAETQAVTAEEAGGVKESQ